MPSDKITPDTGHSCCHGEHDHEHGHHHHEQHDAPPVTAKYFCPMCDGVVSDKPGACPKCGMALERNPTYAKSVPRFTPARCTRKSAATDRAHARFAAWRSSRLAWKPKRTRTLTS